MHHAAAVTATPQQIHATHLKNGWAGIAYHFYVRKDGSVYRGRPIDAVGGHTQGHNAVSLGVCFEGNFEIEPMPQAQKQAGRELVAFLRGLFPKITLSGHRELNATACPGQYFPMDEIIAESEGEDMDGKELYERLNQYLREQPVPEWAEKELKEAIDAGITDGTDPCALVPRYQAAIMAKRALQQREEDAKR